MKRLKIWVLFGMFIMPVQLVAQSSSTITGISNAMNPALSVNGLFLAQMANESANSNALSFV